jgi:hypothetical protein
MSLEKANTTLTSNVIVQRFLVSQKKYNEALAGQNEELTKELRKKLANLTVLNTRVLHSN